MKEYQPRYICFLKTISPRTKPKALEFQGFIRKMIDKYGKTRKLVKQGIGEGFYQVIDQNDFTLFIKEQVEN